MSTPAPRKPPPRIPPPPTPDFHQEQEDEITSILGRHSGYPDADSVLGALGDSPQLGQYLRALATRNAPVMRPIALTKKQGAFCALSVDGKAGAIITHVIRRYNVFRPRDLFATDTSPKPGYATRIHRMFVGALAQPVDDVPTWMFAELWMDDDEKKVCEDAKLLLGTCEETPSVREAARRLRLVEAVRSLTWSTWLAGIDVTVEIAFDADCTWQGVFQGDEIR